MSKVALITGGSRGIGKETVLSFAKEGYDVAINYLGSEESAQAVLDECLSYQVKAILVQGNVALEEDVKRMVTTVQEELGRIDVLVNNSGITRDKLMLKMSEQDFMDVIDVNLKGTFLMCKYVSKIMMKQRSGSIINMSSVVGVSGNIGQCNYASSKAGVIGLTKSLARELAPRHIRVNAVAPGFIETDMTHVLSEQVKESVSKTIPLGHMGEACDVAKLAYFLASEDSKYITGQVIHVDGGMVM